MQATTTDTANCESVPSILIFVVKYVILYVILL